jgi:predicted nucleic acid-binding protein
MAEYIVDASVVMHYLISDTYTVNAKAFFNSVTSQDRLLVPEFCLMECANVLWKQVRFFGMSQPDAEDLLRDLNRLPLKRTPVKRLLRTALVIGLRHQLAIYDSAYIALALQSNVALLTVDQLQARAATSEGIPLVQVTNFRPQ